MNYKVGDRVRSKKTGNEYLVRAIDGFGVYVNKICAEAVSAYFFANESELINDYLTTEEFIKEAEALKFNIHEESEALVIHDRGDTVIARVGTCFPLSVGNMSYSFNSAEIETRQALYDLLDRYARTPLDKRVAEKRFYLKFPKCQDSENCILNVRGGKWLVASRTEGSGWKAIFTEADIPELQEKFPEINFSKLERITVE